MKIMNCKTARKEIDEIFPSGNLSGNIREHVASCGDCSELYRKQSRLQQIVGTLETVSVPNDFEFRLRSRLRESEHARPVWWIKTASVALGAALCLLIAFIVGPKLFVRSRVEPAVDPARSTSVAKANENSAQATSVISNSKDVDKVSSSPALANFGKGASHLSVTTKATSRSQYSTMDFSSERASRISAPLVVKESPAFPIDAPAQELRLSVDDGRGNARTISFPTVSFGSQRVLNNANSLSSKGVW